MSAGHLPEHSTQNLVASKWRIGERCFLDEIAELDGMLQAKLLQLLQDGQFSRIGAQEDKRVEVRVVCADQSRTAREIEQGNFRADLFYRIATMTIIRRPSGTGCGLARSFAITCCSTTTRS